MQKNNFVLRRKLSKFTKLFLISVVIFLTAGIVAQCENIALTDPPPIPNNFTSIFVEPPTPKQPSFENFDKLDKQVQQIIYVNNQHPKANDNNKATNKNLPVKTIGKATEIALENKGKNVGTKIIIYPGIYRESILLNPNNLKNDAPIIFAAKEPGKTIISGADIWNNWQKLGNSNIYTHHWPYNWGFSGNPWTEWKVNLQPIVQRREMVFVGKKLLKQILSPADITPGTFSVSEQDDLIYIYPPDGTNLKKTQVEVAIRPNIFIAKNLKNLVLRGLIFQHANSVLQEAVRIENTTNVLIENVQFIWNNWGGFHLSKTENVIIRNSKANYNGERGFSGDTSKNLLMENTENSYNNWRGAWGEFYGWDAGQKFVYLNNLTMRKYKAVKNQAAGLWFDTGNKNILVEEAYICNNINYSLYIEANPGPITIKNSVICNNRDINSQSLGEWYNPGVLAAVSQNVILAGNVICGNDRSQIRIIDQFDRDYTDVETEHKSKIKMENWLFKNNLIISNKSNNNLIETPQWNHLFKTLNLEENTWYNPNNTKVFKVDGRQLDFTKWQSLMVKNQDKGFSAPSSIPTYCNSNT